MMDQSRIGQRPADYLSSNPAEQRVGDTQGGMESLASYEDGGDMAVESGEGRVQSSMKENPEYGGRVFEDFGAAADLTGTGLSMTDNLSNNGNQVKA